MSQKCHSLQGRPSGKSSLHTEGASEYVQHHAAATLLDRAGYGQLDQPAQQQALIVNINLGPDSPPGDDRPWSGARAERWMIVVMIDALKAA